MSDDKKTAIINELGEIVLLILDTVKQIILIIRMPVIIIVNVSWVAIFALSLTFHYFLNNPNISLVLSSLVVAPWIYKVYAHLHKNNFRIFANPSSGHNKDDAPPLIKFKYMIEILIPFFLMLIIISINNKIIGFSIAITYVFFAFSAKMVSSRRKPDIN